jgi:hypothetical protein
VGFVRFCRTSPLCSRWAMARQSRQIVPCLSIKSSRIFAVVVQILLDSQPPFLVCSANISWGIQKTIRLEVSGYKQAKGNRGDVSKRKNSRKDERQRTTFGTAWVGRKGGLVARLCHFMVKRCQFRGKAAPRIGTDS